MVRNSILIFCLCVCFCQYHISVSLYTHLYTHIINKLLHGWFVCTIFIIHSLWRIAKLTRSLRSLVRLTILHNSWIKIVRTHQSWSNLYIFYKQSVFISRTSISTWLNTVMPLVIFGCYLAVRSPRYIIGQEQNLFMKALIKFSSSYSVVSLEFELL